MTKEDKPTLFRRGMDLWDSGRYAEALPFFERARALDPQDLNALFYLGWSYKKTRDYPKAVEALRVAVALKPDDAYLVTHLGEAYEENKEYDAAACAYDAALALVPDYPYALFGLATLHRAAGDLPRAREYINRVGRIMPLKDAVQVVRGHIAEADGHFEEAVACFERARELGGDVHAELYRVGVKLLHLDRNELARNVLRKALGHTPEHFDTVWNLGLAELRLGRTDEAIAAFDRAADLCPGCKRAYLALVDAYRARGDRRGVGRTLLRFFRNLGAVAEAEARRRQLPL